jgi:hypothetical protein
MVLEIANSGSIDLGQKPRQHRQEAVAVTANIEQVASPSSGFGWAHKSV